LAITHNTIQGGQNDGILVEADTGPNSNVTIHFNTIAGHAHAGVEVVPGGYTGTLDATFNFWGSPSGPHAASNPGGTGDAVLGNVAFTPWLTTPPNTATTLFWKDEFGNLLMIDTLTGNYALALANGPEITGAHVGFGSVAIASRGSHDEVVLAAGPVSGPLKVFIYGPFRGAFTLQRVPDPTNV
jgi:hypothetical protein